jgi:hypothetical protein
MRKNGCTSGGERLMLRREGHEHHKRRYTYILSRTIAEEKL